MIFLKRDKNCFLLKTAQLYEILLHEVFHIISRNNPTLKTALYNLIGFKKVSSKIEINPNLKNRVLLNPDGVDYKYAITLISNDQKQEFLPIIYCKEKVERKEGYFSNLLFDLFPLVDQKVGINMLDSFPNMKSSDLFYNKIGRNTEYIIHPDEILAENFVLLFQSYKGPDQKSTEILNQMKRILFKN
ncbi:MAG: hypothetical protein AAGK97_14650 [Bacteroidota bacterium]